MGNVDFTAENKSKSVFDLDILRLQKNEKARICILDKTAKMQLTHFMRTPESATGRKGRYLVCLGDYKTVMEQGSDPEKCPACSVAEPGQDALISMPRRRFVVHVGRYRTNANGKVITPVSLALQVWMFSDDKFNALVDRAQEHGDLRKKDINLTCTAEMYQKYDIDVCAQMLVSTDKAAVIQYKELLKQRQDDIERLMGQVLTYEAMERTLKGATPEISETEFAEEADKAVVDASKSIADDSVVFEVTPPTNNKKSVKKEKEEDIDFTSLLDEL